MKENLKTNLREFTGSLGDLGTFVPIFIALVAINGLNPTAILVVSGLAYIICGLYYKLPIPVQPLKAMAAVAITLGLRADVIQIASIVIGIILLIISLTPLAKFLPHIFTKPIVKGMQLGVGLMLIKISLVMIFRPYTSAGVLAITPFNLFDIQKISLSFRHLSTFSKAFWLLVLPQLPLTLSNAIVGTCDIAKTYFGQQAKKVTERNLSLDLGIINILSGFISGSMPLCHGSSGLTAHISFGARSGRATIITGTLFLILGLIFGRYAETIFRMIPHAILGLMLLYVGIKHAVLVLGLKEKKEFLLASGIGISGLLTDNLTLALCLGILIWHIPQFIQKLIFYPSVRRESVDTRL